MQIDIQARDFSLTDALRSHAERRLRFALSCCDDHIQRVGGYPTSTARAVAQTSAATCRSF